LCEIDTLKIRNCRNMTRAKKARDETAIIVITGRRRVALGRRKESTCSTNPQKGKDR
jgi:uncharacterized RmlC-like cupin family protein